MSTPSKPARDARGRLLPGHTANPGGRTNRRKGLARLIRDATNDGADLVEFAMSVFANESKAYTHAQQCEMHAWLSDRGFGKAVAPTVELGADSEAALSTDQDLARAISGATLDRLNEMENEIDRTLAALVPQQRPN